MAITMQTSFEKKCGTNGRCSKRKRKWKGKDANEMKLVEPRSAINVTKLSPASLEKLRKAIINKKNS